VGVNHNLGKSKRTCLVYTGGTTVYAEKCDEVVAKGYEGFAFE
jgi:hypothetical protein